jgi:WD40 repeat protein
MLQLSPDDRPHDAAAALALLNTAWSPLPTMLPCNRESESVQQAAEETRPAVDIYILGHGNVGQQSWLSSVAFAPNGQTLAAAQGAVRLWSVSDKSLLCSIDEPAGLANSVAYSPDGQLLAIASPEESTLWSTAGWVRVWAVTRGAGQNNGIVFSADGREIVVAGAMAVERWRVEDGELIAQYRLAHEDLYSIALAPDGAAFVTVVGGTARRWCVTDGTEIGSPIELPGDINAAVLGPGGAVLALLTDTAVLVWGTDDTPPLRLDQGGQQGVFSSDGRLLAIGASGSVWLWNLDPGRSAAEVGSCALLQSFQNQTDVVGALAFSLDGQLLATARWDGTLSIYGPLCLVVS